ncbi:Crp/Fnr family transcriptional regulator [Hyunsoonleella aestuarii]|uniref:Crp/Fnr family transcriptional regulator n=1 Tax=Hyunsoonleella aestuarii TaxID=912802 RepID=A0ABP8ED70_9FLAO|nr:Crp/Fnr family transcriptional regulator [Hyunsoonleella aestuarii]
MNRNFTFLNSITDISEEAFAIIKNISVFRRVPAGCQLVKYGENTSKVYMLVNGIIRCYLSTEEGKEFNKSFYLPISFVGSLTALMKKKPSKFVFETLTDCKLYEIDFYKLMKLCEEDTGFKSLYNKVLEGLYIKYEKRLVELISLDAKERYLALRNQIPNVDELIPQYHIASYLGITAVQLSRIRKKLDGD